MSPKEISPADGLFQQLLQLSFLDKKDFFRLLLRTLSPDDRDRFWKIVVKERAYRGTALDKYIEGQYESSRRIGVDLATPRGDEDECNEVDRKKTLADYKAKGLTSSGLNRVLYLAIVREYTYTTLVNDHPDRDAMYAKSKWDGARKGKRQPESIKLEQDIMKLIGQGITNQKQLHIKLVRDPR